MSSEADLQVEVAADRQWYELDLPIRGCDFTLADIKSAYRDFQHITRQEGEATLGKLIKPEEKSQGEFDQELSNLRKDAFNLTLSIIGEDGVTFYAENESAFDNASLPKPIASIYFTNINSFKRNAGGNIPRQRFEIWLDFRKRPLIDTDTILSDPTPNASKINISAEDLRYFSAIKAIARDKLLSKQRWYSFIHAKLFYDLGLFAVALPYIFFTETVLIEGLIQKHASIEPFRIPMFIYFTYLGLIAYRALIGYAKWAYPVNILSENKDNPSLHRPVIGGLILALIGYLIKTALSFASLPIVG